MATQTERPARYAIAAKVFGVLLALAVVGLSLAPTSVLAGMGVLGRLAVAAKDPTSVALIVVGVVAFIVVQPIMVELKDAGDLKKQPKGDGPKIALAKVRLAVAGVWAAVLCFVTGTAMMTIRAVQAHQPAVLSRDIDKRMDTLRLTVQKNDQSPQQRCLPGWEPKSRAAVRDVQDLLDNSHSALAGEDLARGWALVGGQYVILGDYPGVDEALQKLDALPTRYQAFADELYRYYYLVYLAREKRPLASAPRSDERNERLDELRTMQEAFLTGDLQIGYDTAEKYISRYGWDAENPDNWMRVMLLAEAYAWMLTVIDPSEPENRVLIDQHARRGIELVAIASKAAGMGFITRCDLERAAVQCHIALARMHEEVQDKLAAAREYELALSGLHTLIVKHGVTGQCAQAKLLSTRLASVYEALGDTRARDLVLRRQNDAASACGSGSLTAAPS